MGNLVFCLCRRLTGLELGLAAGVSMDAWEMTPSSAAPSMSCVKL